MSCLDIRTCRIMERVTFVRTRISTFGDSQSNVFPSAVRLCLSVRSFDADALASPRSHSPHASLRRSCSRSFAATPPRRCCSFSHPTAHISGSLRHRSSLRTPLYRYYHHPPHPTPRTQQYLSSRASRSLTRHTSSEHPSFLQPMDSFV